MKKWSSLALAACMTLSLAACAAASSGAAPASSGATLSRPTEREKPESAPAALSRILKEQHPDPFTVISEEAFDEKVAVLDEDWARRQLQEGDAWCALQELAASIGDAHTSVQPAPSMTQKYLPFIFGKYEDTWYIYRTGDNCAQLLGKELLSLNGVPMAQIAQETARMASYQTEGWRDVQVAGMARAMRVLHYLGVADDMRTVVVETKDLTTGQTETWNVPTDNGSYTGDIALPVTMTRAANYAATLLEDGSVYIQYNVCADMEGLPVADFAAQLEEQVGEAVPAKIFVDLRQNTGGNSELIRPLLDVLEGWQKKGGTLYCLIGGQTFSSGAMDAGYLRDMGAVMVGESTGGLEGGFGELGQETLPNGCTLYYSTKDFGSRGPVEPDVEAAQTVEDLLTGRDTVLAAALALEPDKAN